MKRDEVLQLLASHSADLHARGVRSLSLFGSVARDAAADRSDIDLLVEFDRAVGLFAFIDLRDYLQHVLGQRVDLVTPEALRPQLRERILAEAVRAA